MYKQTDILDSVMWGLLLLAPIIMNVIIIIIIIIIIHSNKIRHNERDKKGEPIREKK